MRTTLSLVCTTAALVVGGATAATAAPPERETIPLVCDNGMSYDVEVNGNGSFTPGRIVGSTGVLIPTAFGDFAFRAVLPDGTVVEDSDPSVEAKGGGNVARSPRPTVTCTFSATETLTEDEEGFPAGTVVTFSGSVTGFLTGGR